MKIVGYHQRQEGKMINPILKYFILFISLILFVFLIYVLIRLNIKAIKIKNEFILYLESIEDFDSLYKFGFYNSLYFKENRRVPFLSDVISKAYDETKDSRFLDYLVFIKNISTKMIFAYFFAFISFCVFVGFLR